MTLCFIGTNRRRIGYAANLDRLGTAEISYGGDQEFESPFLQRGVSEPSVPLEMILDLSPRAADALDMKRVGVAAVAVEPLVNQGHAPLIGWISRIARSSPLWPAH